ncbi:glycine betaine ABC transporter substrate-binding protein [Ruegeria sp. HKCCD8929]|uniref:ABC transporter substrate-binding protein n=1 Tax=Ruegeria sp. HKCCD8929 TaxID=2683006 RepID=UPI0014886336|nr:glycine betaine ABC transporter substrate-binding protein [Ruegeria sp. HKCCD8929]
MKARKSFAAICVASAVTVTSTAWAADMVIGVPNWPSGQATAHVLKAALEDRLSLDVELRDSTNAAMFAAMDAGTMHVHPEVWLPSLDYLRREYVDGRKTVKVKASGPKGTQGMCVTKGTAERTGITDLKELSNPEMARKFDADGDGNGDVWIGAEGWTSTLIEQIRARSYRYDRTMNLLIMDEGDALAALDTAEDQDKNVVFYCYAPHYMFEIHDLVMLNEPPHESSKWLILPPTEVPGWLEKSTAGVAWDTDDLHISYATALETAQPDAVAMLSKVSLETDTLSEWTYALAVENQDPSAFAAKWIEDNVTTVDSWFQ